MAEPRVGVRPEANQGSAGSEGASARGEKHFVCDRCEQDIVGEPFGSGLFVWTRGTELRFEEPPLCEECATAITLGAVHKWSVEDDEGEG